VQLVASQERLSSVVLIGNIEIALHRGQILLSNFFLKAHRTLKIQV
jgi:hypothetical protein